MPQTGNNTHFGFQQVALGDKQARVDDVFQSVARRYDLMNDLMSGGLHRAWKGVLVTAVNPPKARDSSVSPAISGAQPFALLDLAGGTGDVAFRAIEAGGADLHATVVDINPSENATAATINSWSATSVTAHGGRGLADTKASCTP